MFHSMAWIWSRWPRCMILFMTLVLSGLSAPVLRSPPLLISVYNCIFCKDNFPFLTPLRTFLLGQHSTSGVHLVGRPGAILIRFVFQISAPLDVAVSSWRGALTHYCESIFNLPTPACLKLSHRSSPRRRLKSHIGYPSIPRHPCQWKWLAVTLQVRPVTDETFDATTTTPVMFVRILSMFFEASGLKNLLF